MFRAISLPSCRLQGEKAVSGLTGDGAKLAINFQVMAVDRPLIAVSRLAAAGYEVCFSRGGGTITHVLTGKVTPFVKMHGAYVLKVWVPKAAATEKSFWGASGSEPLCA